MKLRNREVNIFSMSALDLFASGMGAFLLLAFMALPFFPHTASDAMLQELAAELKRAEQAQSDAENKAKRAEQEAEALSKKVSDLEVPDLDLLICLDITGSMRDEIVALQLAVHGLAEILNKISTTGIGVIAFGDDEWSQVLFVNEITTNPNRIKEFLGDLSVGSGGSNSEPPEAVAEALEAAQRIEWRSASEVRKVVVITDASAQRESAAYDAARSIAANAGYSVSSVLIRSDSSARSFLESLARNGNGEFIDGNEKSILASILLAALD